MKKSLGALTILPAHPVLVVGSYDSQGRPNMATVAWGGICCSTPPCVAISLREATQTHGNILARKAFTVNIPSEHHLREADHAGVVSGHKVDKFETTGLTAVRSELVDAPWVEEFPLVLECRLFQTVEIGLHTQFVGEILDLKADEETLGEKGLPDIRKIQPLVYATGNRAYLGIGELLGKAFRHKEL
jgi:flavin reductase (DIM6/NTAB) family NADH-FMN oxidoreductase RutF